MAPDEPDIRKDGAGAIALGGSRVALELVAVAALVVALIGGLGALAGGYRSRERVPGLGAVIESRQENPWQSGGEYSGGGMLVALPEAPAAARLFRVTFAPGASYEVPDGAVAIVDLASGALTIERTPGGAIRMTGHSLGDVEGPGVLRNDQADAVTVSLALVTADQDEPLAPVRVELDELAGGEVERLPRDWAIAEYGSAGLREGGELQAPRELTDTGRDELALVWVESGNLALSHQLGITRVRRTDGRAEPTLRGPGDELVPLAAGDWALIEAGAAFDVANGGGGTVEVTFLSLINPERITDSDLIAAEDGTPAAEVRAGVPDEAPQIPPAGPAEGIDPSECRAEPRSVADVEALLGTPIAAQASGATEEPFVERPDQLPQGLAADAETVAAVTELERQFVACYNTGDVARVLGLFSDEAARELVSSLLQDRRDGASVEDLLAASTGPLPAEERIVFYPLRGVRVLPDGRVGAVVEWGSGAKPGVRTEANFNIYRQTDGRWVIDEEIGSFVPGL